MPSAFIPRRQADSFRSRAKKFSDSVLDRGTFFLARLLDGSESVGRGLKKTMKKASEVPVVVAAAIVGLLIGGLGGYYARLGKTVAPSAVPEPSVNTASVAQTASTGGT